MVLQIGRRFAALVIGGLTGLVDDFSGYYHHLELPAGRHRVEVFGSPVEPVGTTVSAGLNTAPYS